MKPRITRVKARKTTADTHEMPSMVNLFAKYRVKAPDGHLIDPFARNCDWAQPYTNDLNPDTGANDHLDAEEYLDRIREQGISFVLGILDPPFSNRQAGEIYGTPNLYASDSAKMTRVGRKLGDLIEPGGYIIKCGYNSNPIHPSFECIEIRMVYHGGTANDTVFSVWQNVNRKIEEWT
jgi:hypothetical protein